jgi:hypothetical protein
VQRTEHAKRHRKRDRVGDKGPLRRPTQPRPDRLNQRRQRAFTERTQRQARQSDAQLDTRDHSMHVAQQLFNDSRARVALLHQLPHARKPHRDQRKFRGRKKTVKRYQNEYTNEAHCNHGSWSYPLLAL